MNTIILSWESWRAVIAVLREKALPYMREHADYIAPSAAAGSASTTTRAEPARGWPMEDAVMARSSR
jgi:hypothetical protein